MKIYAAYAVNGLNKRGLGPVVIVVRMGRNYRRHLQTGIELKPGQWDKKKGRCKLVALQNKIDAKINQIEAWKIGQIEKGLQPDGKMFDFWLKNGALADDFLHFYGVTLDKDKSLLDESKRSQKRTLFFLRECFNKIPFENLKRMMVDEFNNYLAACGLSQNTIKAHHKNFKKFINLAIDYGKLKITIDQHPYRTFKTGAWISKRDYLTCDDLSKIDKCQLSGKDERVKDLFLFSCATGMRFKDTQTAHIAINDGVLTYTPGKTIKHTGAVSLPVDVVCADWIRLPLVRITNQEANRVLKYIMIQTEIEKVLTFHVSRHTFLTHVAKNTGSIFKVMKYGGLKKTDTAMIYVHLAGI